MADGPDKPKEVLKKAPTLYAITVFKLVKGVLFMAVALVIYQHSDRDLPAEYQNLLEWLHHWLKLNPEREFWTDMAQAVENLTETKVMHVAMGTFIYSLFSLVEGTGLLFRAKWAGWMTIGESAFFIPIEVHHLTHNKPTWFVFSILVANIIIVWYLFRNRERLFRHHNLRLHKD
jgi:uncharacterized membrane protein (DUF2068 family)